MEDKSVNSEISDDSSVQEEQEQFETTPEEATGFVSSQKPKIFKRKKTMIVICCSLAGIICFGLIYNSIKPEKKKNSGADNEFASANSSKEFLSGLRDRALNRREPEKPQEPAAQEPAKVEIEKEPALPPVSFNKPPQEKNPPPPPAAPQGNSAPASSEAPQTPTHYKSSLVPPIQGSLFSQGYPGNGGSPGAAAQRISPSDAPSGAARNPYVQPGQVSDYISQNDQQNKQSFFDASSGAAASGQFIGSNSIWTGTVIPGILETSINTDLPGNILARVTQNIFDSQTGQKLLIPQGTLLLARYNSSISYSQKRIQIVWDTMIRPDGFQINLEGAGGVDRAGMSGQPARFHENWFEYLKAAGIITLFSYANAKMTETAAKYASEDKANNLAAANADFVNNLGGQLAGRAANIQPTLTVENGTLINILLNKNLYLPPVSGYPASEKYLLE
jgi:type IV secretion system protein TrbI